LFVVNLPSDLNIYDLAEILVVVKNIITPL